MKYKDWSQRWVQSCGCVAGPPDLTREAHIESPLRNTIPNLCLAGGDVSASREPVPKHGW
jgi:hypothetical protein